MVQAERKTGNFPEGRYIFEGTGILIYPGDKGGNRVVENLTTYREDPTFFPESDIVRSSRLEFDIERHVGWDPWSMELHPFSYSMMINGRYPVSRWEFLGGKSRSTVEEFSSIAQVLSGFVFDQEITLARNGLHTYRNKERNVFINWSKRDGRINIGVIQERPVSNLRVVTDEIVPYAVDVFNRLSPTYQIGEDLVRRSVEAAIEGSKIIPQRRTVQS